MIKDGEGCHVLQMTTLKKHNSSTIPNLELINLSFRHRLDYRFPGREPALLPQTLFSGRNVEQTRQTGGNRANFHHRYFVCSTLVTDEHNILIMYFTGPKIYSLSSFLFVLFINDNCLFVIVVFFSQMIVAQSVAAPTLLHIPAIKPITL